MRAHEAQLAARPVDPERAAQYMLEIEQRQAAWQLQELRKELGLTQEQVARELGVTQKRVSQIEVGAIDSAQLSTLRRYITGLGGRLVMTVEVGQQSYHVA